MRKHIEQEVTECYMSVAKDFPQSKFIKGISLEKIKTLSDIELFEMLQRLNNVIRGIKDISMVKSRHLEIKSDRLNHDALTGLSGTHAFRGLTDKDLESKTVLLLMDLNGLKGVNDFSQSKHAAGDLYISTIGQVIRDYTRNEHIFIGQNDIDQSGTGYRYGGDELAILFDNCSKEDALKIGERINRKFKEIWDNLYAEKEMISSKYIGLSYGAAEINKSKTREQIIMEAETELIEMKNTTTDIILQELDIKQDPKNPLTSRAIIAAGIRHEQMLRETEKPSPTRRQGDRTDSRQRTLDLEM